MDELEILYARATLMELYGSYSLKGTNKQKNDIAQAIEVNVNLSNENKRLKSDLLTAKILTSQALKKLDEYKDEIYNLKENINARY